MTLEQILELMEARQIEPLTTMLQAHRPESNVLWPTYQKQLFPHLHKIMKERFDKVVPIYADGAAGEQVQTGSKVVKVNKLPISMQKKIVLFASVFLGNPRADCNPEGDIEQNLYDVIDFLHDANKMQYRFPDLVRIVMSERHGAELWYIDPNPKAEFYSGQPIDSDQPLKMKILANSLGDNLYPVFDEFDDMIAFGRGYFMFEVVNDRVEKVQHFDLYTDEEVYYSKRDGTGWVFYAGPGISEPGPA